MLEPREIRTHRFAQVRQGYKPEDVDAFLGQAAEAYEQTRKELEQLRILAEQTAESLKNCLAERESISRVLTKAQSMADDIRKEANEEVRSLIAAADREAKETVREARQKADDTIREATGVAQERLKKAADTADKVEAIARERAETVERAAEQKAYAALHSLEDQRTAIRQEVDELTALSARFKLEMINAYEHQLRVLRQMPDEIIAGREQITMPAAAVHEEETPEPVEETASEEPADIPAEAEPVEAAENTGRYSGYFAE